MQVTRMDVVHGLRELGLGRGDGVMVHSSLKSFGYVVGGARTVIDALMEVVSLEGTVMMPSFNHGAAFAQGAKGYFCPGETPTTNGAIASLFWQMDKVYRSLNPTHSFAAWGANGRRYTEFHHRTLTMGSESPLGLLLKDGGWGLLLGVGYHSNTLHHVAEMTTGAQCLGRRTEAHPVVLPDGRQVEGRTWSWRAQSCPFTDGVRYGPDMKRQGLQRVGHIGHCRVTLFRLQDCYRVIAESLWRGRDGYPPCSKCPIRPRRGPHTVPSDWDEQAQRPVPGSACWAY